MNTVGATRQDDCLRANVLDPVKIRISRYHDGKEAQLPDPALVREWAGAIRFKHSRPTQAEDNNLMR